MGFHKHKRHINISITQTYQHYELFPYSFNKSCDDKRKVN